MLEYVSLLIGKSQQHERKYKKRRGICKCEVLGGAGRNGTRGPRKGPGLWWIMYTTGLPPLLSANNAASYLRRNQAAEGTSCNLLPPTRNWNCLSSPLSLLLFKRQISSKPNSPHLLQKLLPPNSQWPWPVLIFTPFLVSSTVPFLLVGSFPWVFICNQIFPTSNKKTSKFFSKITSILGCSEFTVYNLSPQFCKHSTETIQDSPPG